MTVESRPSSSASIRRRLARLDAWRDEVRIYWRECARPRDFLALMRVRLSQSKVGRWVTPAPITVKVDLNTLGPAVSLRSHIDLGANVGLSYRWLRSRYPRARFVCVEPDPGNLEILRANVRAVDDRAVIHGVCVGAHERRVTLASTSGEWGFRMTDAEDPDDAIDVMTMDALLEGAGFDRIGVLKCDIEGAEAEVFADCRSWIDRVDAMSVECHSDVMRTEALLNAVSSNGGQFSVRHLESNPHLGFDIVTLQRDAPA